MIDLSPSIMFTPHGIDTLRHVQTETTSRIRPANDIIQHDIGIAVTQARVIMIFYTDDIRGIQGLDLILFHLHAIDTHLDYPISRGLDLTVQQIHLHSR